MDDLRSQLAATFGRTPEPTPGPDAAASDAGPDLLGPDAHLADPWLDALRAACQDRDLPDVPARPSLGAARQLTDKALKALKARGDKRALRALKDARAAFESRREKHAWAGIKARFGELGLSMKVYRSLKQTPRLDPVKVHAKLHARASEQLKGLGASRLREALLGA